jgi:hypothetical protein
MIEEGKRYMDAGLPRGSYGIEGLMPVGSPGQQDPALNSDIIPGPTDSIQPGDPGYVPTPPPGYTPTPTPPPVGGDYTPPYTPAPLEPTPIVTTHVSPPTHAPQMEPPVEGQPQDENQEKRDALTDELGKRHPGFAEKIGSDEFIAYVNADPTRKALYNSADVNYDVDAASSLIQSFDTENGTYNQGAQSMEAAQQTERETNLRNITGETSSSGDAITGRNTYNRAELINLKISDPDKYDANDQEILKAYSEGRVKW